jgi:hypothetical protein
VNGNGTLPKEKLFGKGNAERSVLLYMNAELSWWNVAEAEHRAPDSVIRRKLFLTIAAHIKARAEFLAVARLQPAPSWRSKVKSITQNLQEECVSFGIVGFAIRQLFSFSDKMG